MSNKNDLRKVTAWRRLERTRDVLSDILGVTEKGLPISETEQALIQQELLIAVGSIVTFSECLASGELHE
ncbi:hypothetical protein [Enterococcus sp. 5H]|uniref:hypothetical protein n=1 Tax=Enterococcus sp. 5H TaxID=1229490 RepID=UPI002303D5EC|nr:hypothetical protein [Enterococcus sp. 5H]MDA9472278.1 hypothetical protein [Enterococcus sp. 5H]